MTNNKKIMIRGIRIFNLSVQLLLCVLSLIWRLYLLCPELKTILYHFEYFIPIISLICINIFLSYRIVQSFIVNKHSEFNKYVSIYKIDKIQLCKTLAKHSNMFYKTFKIFLNLIYIIITTYSCLFSISILFMLGGMSGFYYGPRFLLYLWIAILLSILYCYIVCMILFFRRINIAC